MVSSEEGRGTCFTIEIPFETAAPPQSEHPETLLANYRVPANSKILVVEDHPMNQEMIRALFSELGSEIYLARSGSEGISMVERYCPDIVFMDIHMPEIDGYETFEKIQKLNPNLPVVGLSADAFKEHQEAALKAGFSAYLTKPIQLTKLVSVLRQFLQFPVTENPGKRSLNKQQSNQKKMALQAIKNLPIFETEKLVSVAASLSEILPATDLSKLEDAIYAGDDAALQEFLTNSLDG
jgi:CheY-like chemotaxis protein